MLFVICCLWEFVVSIKLNGLLGETMWLFWITQSLPVCFILDAWSAKLLFPVKQIESRAHEQIPISNVCFQVKAQ